MQCLLCVSPQEYLELKYKCLLSKKKPHEYSEHYLLRTSPPFTTRVFIYTG